MSMQATEQKYFTQRRICGKWWIKRFKDNELEREYGPLSWVECDEQSRILIQAGYDKERV